MIEALHFIRVWDSRTAQVRNRFFFRSEILIGSDKSNHLRLKDLKGFEAKIQFYDGTLRVLENAGAEQIYPQKIFQIGSYAFHWRKINLRPKFDRRKMILSLFLLTVGIGLLSWTQGRALPSCPLFSVYLKNPVSKNLVTAFEKAVARKAFVKARADLSGIKKDFSLFARSESCEQSSDIKSLEASFWSGILQQNLEAKDGEAAAKNLNALKSLSLKDRREFLLERRVVDLARDFFLEGYRMEDQDFEKGLTLMEKARSICRSLGKPEECFRSQSIKKKASLENHER